MRNNAWIALALVFGIIAFAMLLRLTFITVNTPDGESIEGTLFSFQEGNNITITGNDATNTITIGTTGSLASNINVQTNGTTAVTGTDTINFISPFNVTDQSSIADIGITWPDCDLRTQATTFAASSNAIQCEFIPASVRITNISGQNWSLPGWACNQTTASVALFQNDILYGFIVPPSTMTLTAIGINVSTAGAAGSLARLGIYEANETNDGYTPGTLIVDAGTVAIDTTGSKLIAINTTLEQGKPYFTAFVHDAVTASMSRCDSSFLRNAPITGLATSTSGNFTLSTPIASNIGTGAFADPASTPDSAQIEVQGTIVKVSE